MVGVRRWVLLAGSAAALAACTIDDDDERSERKAVGDRFAADASPHPSDAGIPIDAGILVDATSGMDALDYYCNVPEPGPCCCDPRGQVIPVPPADAPHADARSYSCDFAIEKRRGDINKYNILARAADGTETTLPRSDDCPADQPAWSLRSEEPRIGRLCPVACEAFLGGAYTALVVIHGCYSIACPPPP